MRNFVVASKEIYYEYDDDYAGIVDDNDIEHVGELVGSGYIEGELATTDPNELDLIHYGWWTVKPPASAPNLLKACQLLSRQLIDAIDYVSSIEPFPTDHNAGMWNAALKETQPIIQKATGGT